MTRDIVLSALREVESLRVRLDALLKSYDAEAAGTAPPALKKDNGRLTDAGVAHLRVMIDAERTDTEIARDLGVTPAAIRLHRAKYSAEKVKPKRARRKRST